MLAQPLPVAAARFELRPVDENDRVFAVEIRMKLFDPFGIDDDRPVNTQKTPVEPRLQGGHRLAHEGSLRSRVQTHVIADGFHPIYLFIFDEEDAPAGFDDEAVRERGLFCRRGRRRDLQVGEQRREFLAECALASLFEMSASALQSQFEAIVIDRLQQIIEGVHIKSAQRIVQLGSNA
jgi:hypothetical protein